MLEKCHSSLRKPWKLDEKPQHAILRTCLPLGEAAAADIFMLTFSDSRTLAVLDGTIWSACLSAESGGNWPDWLFNGDIWDVNKRWIRAHISWLFILHFWLFMSGTSESESSRDVIRPGFLIYHLEISVNVPTGEDPKLGQVTALKDWTLMAPGLCCVYQSRNVLWVFPRIQLRTSRARTHDRGCTCTVIFISRPQLLHITTVGFHKAKARMNPPANSHRRTESVWRGWEPTGMQRWLRMQCTAIYIYIYIYRIYTKQQWDPNKTPDISFYTNTEQRRTNFFFFFLNKKNSFCSFLCKSATQSK